MDAVKFLKERQRMFKMAGGYEEGIACDGASCKRCAFYIKTEPFCLEDLQDYEGMEAKLEEWIAENPKRTYKQDFLEKYPNAPLNENNIPKFCLCNVGYLPIENQPCMIGECGSCLECWNRSME